MAIHMIFGERHFRSRKMSKYHFPVKSYSKLKYLTPSGPGGGLKGLDGQTHSCQSETSYSMMPKLGDV